MKYVVIFKDAEARDLRIVGGKNASLGNMLHDLADKVQVPNGFAITVQAYWYFLQANGLVDQIKNLLSGIDISNENLLEKNAQAIQTAILNARWPDGLQREIAAAYQDLCSYYKQKDLPVAVRSSATAEDLPTASFAGQQESFLQVIGQEALLDAAKRCMASLFTERAIFYRVQNHFDHMKVGLSVGIQKMVQSDKACAGVAFSIDPETGFKSAIVINGSWGFGELVVKGQVTPDEFILFKDLIGRHYRPIIKKELGKKDVKLLYDSHQHALKKVETTEQERGTFSLSDDELLELAAYVKMIEDYYSKKNDCWSPQDIEWAKDGVDNKIYIVQARPETIYSTKKDQLFIDKYSLNDNRNLTIIAQGLSVGQGIISGKAHVIKSVHDINSVKSGDIIITQMTDPDWVPAMKKAAAIITDQGGRTCHAAIVSRELGIPALVGTGNATESIATDVDVTVDCSQGDVGYVYAGIIPFAKKLIDLGKLKPSPVTLLLNIADPHRAFAVSKLPVEGVGLARIEFILSNQIGIHPMAIVMPEKLNDDERKQIARKAVAYKDAKTFYIEKLAQGMGMIAAAFYPHQVTVRLSDLKTNEYRNLLGGEQFEPTEENPMIGWRGASRYYHEDYQHAFALECEAFKMARNIMGFDNIRIMIPFTRTVGEAQKVINVMQQYGLSRGKDTLQLIMMIEIPANVILIDQFVPFFDGFSIGSNDLTQLTLGIDRDSALMAPLFDERNDAVKKMIELSVKGAHAADLPVGICGQAPSDYPEFVEYLLSIKIDSISLNPDAVVPFLMKQ